MTENRDWGDIFYRYLVHTWTDSKHKYNAIPIPPTPQTLNTTYMVSSPRPLSSVGNSLRTLCIYGEIKYITNSRLIVLLLVSNILLAHYHGFWNGFYGFLVLFHHQDFLSEIENLKQQE